MKYDSVNTEVVGVHIPGLVVRTTGSGRTSRRAAAASPKHLATIEVRSNDAGLVGGVCRVRNDFHQCAKFCRPADIVEVGTLMLRDCNGVIWDFDVPGRNAGLQDLYPGGSRGTWPAR